MKARKKKIMNFMVAIIVMLVGQLAVAQDFKSNRDSFNFMKQRPNIRESSNFRPDTLATAVGFGKRANNPYLMIDDKPKYFIISSSLKNIVKRIPMYWLSRHARRYLESLENKSRINTKNTIMPSSSKSIKLIILL